MVDTNTKGGGCGANDKQLTTKEQSILTVRVGRLLFVGLCVHYSACLQLFRVEQVDTAEGNVRVSVRGSKPRGRGWIHMKDGGKTERKKM